MVMVTGTAAPLTLGPYTSRPVIMTAVVVAWSVVVLVMVMVTGTAVPLTLFLQSGVYASLNHLITHSLNHSLT